MSAETRILDLQADIVARLASDEYFVDIPVLTERKGSIEADIAEALGVITGKAGKVGVCVVVIISSAEYLYPNVLDGPLVIKFTVAVLENVEANMATSTGTLKAAFTVATRVLNVLQQYQGPGKCDMVMPERNTIKVIPNEDGLVAYGVDFMTNEDARTATTKVAQPIPSISGSTLPKTVTLTCAAPAAAAIYYTLDSSYPSAINTAHATLYTVPFSVTTACWLRAGASKTGYIDSDISLTEIN